MPIALHHADGRTEETLLILGPGQVEVYAVQLEKAITQRKESFS